MKSVFSVCRIFLFFFFVVCIFSSCTNYLVVNGGQHVPRKRIITIINDNLGTGELTMVDELQQPAARLDAYPKQKIKWEITATDVHIDSIDAKPTSSNPTGAVFKKKIKKNILSKTWKGILKDKNAIQLYIAGDSAGVHNYDYTIFWHKKHQPVPPPFDPRIQIR